MKQEISTSHTSTATRTSQMEELKSFVRDKKSYGFPAILKNFFQIVTDRYQFQNLPSSNDPLDVQAIQVGHDGTRPAIFVRFSLPEFGLCGAPSARFHPSFWVKGSLRTLLIEPFRSPAECGGHSWILRMKSGGGSPPFRYLDLLSSKADDRADGVISSTSYDGLDTPTVSSWIFSTGSNDGKASVVVFVSKRLATSVAERSAACEVDQIQMHRGLGLAFMTVVLQRPLFSESNASSSKDFHKPQVVHVASDGYLTYKHQWVVQRVAGRHHEHVQGQIFWPVWLRKLYIRFFYQDPNNVRPGHPSHETHQDNFNPFDVGTVAPHPARLHPKHAQLHKKEMPATSFDDILQDGEARSSPEAGPSDSTLGRVPVHVGGAGPRRRLAGHLRSAGHQAAELVQGPNTSSRGGRGLNPAEPAQLQPANTIRSPFQVGGRAVRQPTSKFDPAQPSPPGRPKNLSDHEADLDLQGKESQISPFEVGTRSMPGAVTGSRPGQIAGGSSRLPVPVAVPRPPVRVGGAGPRRTRVKEIPSMSQEVSFPSASGSRSAPDGRDYGRRPPSSSEGDNSPLPARLR
ncbi:hypothetical protein T439DRAFT_355938 [Meredithblackwellia eburnea MCA 4105]